MNVRKKLCCLMSVVLSLGVLMPTGALEAVAEQSGDSGSAVEATADSSDSADETSASSTSTESNADASTTDDDTAATTDAGNVSAVEDDSNGANYADETSAASKNSDEAASSSNDSSLSSTSSSGSSAFSGTSTDLSEKTFAYKQAALALTALGDGSNSTGSEVNAEITGIHIENNQGDTTTSVDMGSYFYLVIDWQVTNQNQILHAGDYFDITLPDTLMFPSSYTDYDFDIYDETGQTVVGHATITPGTDSVGGTIHIVLNENIENKYSVKGSLKISATRNRNNQTTSTPVTITVSTNTSSKSTDLTFTETGFPSDEVVGKWGVKQTVGEDATEPNQAYWYVRINYGQADLQNVTISDHLTNGNGNETYVTDSFHLYKVTYVGNNVDSKTEVNDYSIQFGDDNKSFTITLGDIGASQYVLEYNTTYTAGTTLTNNVTVDADEIEKSASSSVVSSDSSGNASGTLANKIKITKVDAEDNSVTLANATFTVTAPDGSTFELTTGDDGTVTSGVLTAGTYKVKEKTAPTGYELNDTVYTLEVTSSGGALQTVTDTPEKTSVYVNKRWFGDPVDSVTVHLLANGTDTGKSLQLTAATNWEATFEDLRAYDTSGNEITYTVSEDAIDGYTSNISGDATNGFTITNTQLTTESVTKKWIGDVGDTATVNLWRNDNASSTTLVATITLDGLADKAASVYTPTGVTMQEDEAWHVTFGNMPVYDENGYAYLYTVTESAIAGYKSHITRNATGVHTITNIQLTSVGVTKKWVGEEGTSATVNLVRTDNAGIQSTVASLSLDGQADEFVTIDATTGITAQEDGDGWHVTFSKMPMYDADGNAYSYAVTENDMDGYASEITGDAASGFVITNTNTETVDVSGTKAWDDTGNQDGLRPSSITVNLLRDGTKIDSAEVSADESGNWSFSFDGLAKYDSTDGHEYAYTVEEATVPDGYTSAVSGSVADGFTITNTHTPATVSVPVSKVWVGPEGESVTVHLYADGEDLGLALVLNADNNWSGSFDNLAKYFAGNEVVYTVVEDSVENYSTAITGDASTGYIVTNTNTETVDVSGTKIWDDADDQDGIRPDSVTVNLLRDGTVVGTATVTADADGNWSFSFDNLAKYDSDGNEYTYTVEEADVPDGYTSAVVDNGDDTFTITNTHTPETTTTTDTDEGTTSTTSSTSSSMPKTNDDSPIAPLALAAIFAAAALGVAVPMKRRAARDDA